MAKHADTILFFGKEFYHDEYSRRIGSNYRDVNRYLKRIDMIPEKTYQSRWFQNDRYPYPSYYERVGQIYLYLFTQHLNQRV